MELTESMWGVGYYKVHTCKLSSSASDSLEKQDLVSLKVHCHRHGDGGPGGDIPWPASSVSYREPVRGLSR